MRRLLTCALVLFSLICKAQTFRDLSTNDGLSSKKVYAIRKDKTGYMWFLTHEGIDRYDGKDFVHYTLSADGTDATSLQDLNWLYTDTQGIPWEIGKRGRIFGYNPTHDEFSVAYTIPPEDRADNPTPISFSFIDDDDCIWMCGDSTLYLYDIKTRQSSRIPHKFGTITSITPYTGSYFFAGTKQGIYLIELNSDKQDIIPHYEPQTFITEIDRLYYDKFSDKLIIGTFYQGIYVHHLKTKNTVKLDLPSGIRTTCVQPLSKDTLLIATDGAGVIKLNVITNESEPFVLSDTEDNKYTANNVVNAIYVDEAGRIWIAVYPFGIVIQDNRYLQYKLYQHHAGNPQSLTDGGVNHITEDSNGNIWFATNNGISCYDPRADRWESFLSSTSSSNKNNHIFYSLCELSDNTMLASGYCPAIYRINKTTRQAEAIQLTNDNYPDKHIRCLLKDGDNTVWSGGNILKKINLTTRQAEPIPGIEEVNTIIHHDNDHLWVGSAKGLFLVNKENKDFTRIETPLESPYIYSLCRQDSTLLMGTNGYGLLVYRFHDNAFQNFHKGNSALASNNIYSIVYDGKNIILTTEAGLARYIPEDTNFNNWTREQGLRINDFNPNSGTVLKNGFHIFGGCNGAIQINPELRLPKDNRSVMFFSDFTLFNQKVFPHDEGSPLTESINDTQKLTLKASQNIFSLKVSCINYDSPSDIVYSWKLEGLYDAWNLPSKDNIIRYTNLSPGTYTLHVRALSSESRRILQERSMEIVVEPPFFTTSWAIVLYIAAAVFLIAFLIRLLYLRKEKNILDERFRFFLNTAHDIRTPLTLIKSPLEEIKSKEQLTNDGISKVSTALRNVNVLLRMSENLVSIQRSETFENELNLSEYELNSYMEEMMKTFQPYADSKKINFTYESNFRFLTVWLDKEKTDSILQNIITNALKFTPHNGSVSIYASEKEKYWSIEIKDTGIGIPENEQPKLFKENFRGSNIKATGINGTGVGMMITGRLLKTHKAKASFTSIENRGTTITLHFPLDKKQYRNANFIASNKVTPPSVAAPVANEAIAAESQADTPKPEKKTGNGPRILIVEDNSEMEHYLRSELSGEYTVQSCRNGKEALVIIGEYNPELIIADILMPEMGGDELCKIVKANIDTSHIPVILITALNDEENILKGIQTGADDHFTKPFNMGILKASVANLLKNRALLRSKYATLDLKEEEENDSNNCVNCNTNIDWEFIASIKRHVEENMSKPSFTVDTLCSLMNMSRTSFYNKIKALTDTSPKDYIRVIKLKRAAELLKEGKHNVTEVAEMTGFNDAKYFREVFKKYYHVSPSKYREQL